MMEFISQPWAWYVSGPLIGLVMFTLLWLGGEFGVSSTLRTCCSALGAGKKFGFFDFNWKSQTWNLLFVLGAVIGGFIAHNYLSAPVEISDSTITALNKLGINFNGEIVPAELFSLENALTIKGFLFLLFGGFLVGFGSRYAGGCTSGHAISGLSNFQLPSLIAVIGFFIGGLVSTYFLLPILL